MKPLVGRPAPSFSSAAVARSVIGPLILLGTLSAVGLFVNAALGDPLVGVGSALLAFIAAAPVLGPVFGAQDGRNRS